MRLLLTTDDGIAAPGLEALVDIARQLTTEDNIITVAPAGEQSGVGHCISYRKTIRKRAAGPNRFAIEGSPADCVIAALHNITQDNPPDLILSGVNRGNNAAQNTLYSGTVGAAMEAALQGHRAIALSQFFGPELAQSADMFSAARAYGAQVVDDLLEAGLWENAESPIFYNVNFPPVTADAVRGTKLTYQGFRASVPFVAHDGDAHDEISIQGTGQHEPTAQGSDVHANLEGYVAITPCSIDLTCHASLGKLEKAFS